MGSSRLSSFREVKSQWVLDQVLEFEQERKRLFARIVEDRIRRERCRRSGFWIFASKSDDDGFHRTREEALLSLCKWHHISTEDPLESFRKYVRSDMWRTARLIDRVARLQQMAKDGTCLLLCDRDFSLLYNGLEAALDDGYYRYLD